MRARISENEKLYLSRGELKKEVLKICDEEQNRIFKECADDIMIQALCVVLWTLTTQYGWKEKRLKDFVSALQSTNDLMCNPSKLHHRFYPPDCEKTLKEKYNIDLRKEFKANVITK